MQTRITLNTDTFYTVSVTDKFFLSTQTSGALTRTLLCNPALIGDLLKADGYDFVLTTRCQSGPVERRFG